MTLTTQIHASGNANVSLNGLHLTDPVSIIVLYLLIVPPYSLLSISRVDFL